MIEKIKVGIFVFNEVEVLDFSGPFEVFSLAEKVGTTEKIFDVKTISQKKGIITARNNLKILPDEIFNYDDLYDVLIIPGGYGAEHIELYNGEVIHWISANSKKSDIIASVCTGAFILAESGLLNGFDVTTHWMDTDRLQSMYPQLKVVKNKPFVDNGKIITSAGISSGITMSLHIVERLAGKGVAGYTAKRMEYNYQSAH